MLADLNRLRRQLQDDREWLLEELRGYSLTAGENLGYGNHMADDATEVFEQAKSLALQQRLEHSLSQIERALEKLDAGTYGICEACGQPIDPARLEAIPVTQYCMSCRQRVEHMR